VLPCSNQCLHACIRQLTLVPAGRWVMLLSLAAQHTHQQHTITTWSLRSLGLATSSLLPVLVCIHGSSLRQPVPTPISQPALPVLPFASFCRCILLTNTQPNSTLSLPRDFAGLGRCRRVLSSADLHSWEYTQAACISAHLTTFTACPAICCLILSAAVICCHTHKPTAHYHYLGTSLG
jgi:hypothetical protein